MIILGGMLVFVTGVYSADNLPTQLQFAVPILHLVLALGYIVVSRVRRLARLKLPVLLLLSATSGAVVSALAIPLAYAGIGVVAAIALTLLLLPVVAYGRLTFERLQGGLSLLALTFSLLGALLVYAQAISLLTVGWALAALVCLAALLHTALAKMRGLLKPEQVVDSAAGVFLLNIGVVTNVVIVLLALNL